MRACVLVVLFAVASTAAAEPPAAAPSARPAAAAATRPARPILRALAPAALEPEARHVTVTYKSGVIMAGTIASEDPTALIIDCDLGRLSIPRARIAIIAYDVDAAPRIPIVEDPARKDPANVN